ncbi:uncharacterized protein Gasu_62870 [Galdieria sulphuraria]|uniref:Uncharacterized protein n=1 Tax=Galdieria sulphuraria TaxID=130081 RepID=M2X888_GALSU|nr:uncharacterized protein Gasu_62870 [Galdieria sulphuraria]EME26062.1 hypothetical protein Gasu_62870 [Galdieria sulphuraria]|eukprot:XP_005702582.1 hypothetical protein Gasu_62870 [Galdieria sulphuraria]
MYEFVYRQKYSQPLEFSLILSDQQRKVLRSRTSQKLVVAKPVLDWSNSTLLKGYSVARELRGPLLRHCSSRFTTLLRCEIDCI